MSGFPPDQSGQVRTCQFGHDWLDDGSPALSSCPVCGQAANSAYVTHVVHTAVESPRVISEIPGYEVIDELGRGAMGVVYAARQVALNRSVALKLLRFESNSPAALARFCREGELLASLQHPNIIPIYDIGEADGRPFMAMELVGGGSLGDVLDATPLPPVVAARIMLLLARTMHAAHQRGIIHRDLKPANVLIALLDPTAEWASAEEKRAAFIACFEHERGNDKFLLKVADFGLAYSASPEHKEDARVVGTPAYMSPEQADGKPAGAEADVYSLGVMLYEMLTGRPPFLAESALLTLMQLMSCDVVPPSQLQPGVPVDLENICLKCLQKWAPRRYRKAQDLADDLQRFLDGKPVRARPIGLLERTRKWARRQPAHAALAGVVVATLIGVFALLVGFNLRLQEERDRARSNELFAEQQTDLAQARELEAQRQVDRARRALYALQLVQVRALVDNQRERAIDQLGNTGPCPFDLRDLAWNYLVARCQGKGDPVAESTVAARQVRYSPDGSFLAVLGPDDQGHDRILILNSRTKAQEAELRSAQRSIADLALSPDGKLLATAGLDGSVVIWDRVNQRVRHTISAHRPSVRSVAFAPDGKTLASGGDDRHVRVWDVNSGKETAALLGHAASVRAVAFTPDGKQVASGSSDTTIKLWDLAESRARATLQGHRGEVLCLAFSPDGNTLASGDFFQNQGEMRLWQVEPARAAAVIDRRDGVVLSLDFTSDGRTLLAGDSRGTLRLCDPVTGQERVALDGGGAPLQGLALSPAGTELVAATGKSLRTWTVPRPPLAGQLHGHAGPVTTLAFSPSSKLLASAGGDAAIKLWDVHSGQVHANLEGHAGWIHAVVFTPDGKTLASGDERGVLLLWDVATGKEAARYPQHDQAIRSLACSPDGRWLATGSKDGSVKLRDLTEGGERTVLERTGGEVRAVAFAPDGRTLAAGIALPTGEGGIRLIDLQADDEVRTLPGPRQAIVDLRFSPDGKLLACADRSFLVQVFELPEGKLKYEVPRSGLPVFDPAGRQLLVSGFNHTTRAVDAQTGQPLGPQLTQHRDVVSACAVSPDGKLLATGSWDQTIWLRSSGQ
ncbi:MAG: protein kinase [Gemmataceae bacterium]